MQQKLQCFAIAKGWRIAIVLREQLSVSANNLFDTLGLTEAEEGAIPANGIIRARSINGRTISATARFSF